MTDPLFTFLSQAVTPWHAAEALSQRLAGAGFHELTETESWDLKPGQGYYFRRGGTALAAFVTGTQPQAGWRIATAHTDSPGWRLKTATQRPQSTEVVRIGTEVYGSPIHSTWFDRPLSIAGRVLVRSSSGPREILIKTDPVALFPNLAIHYNREVNKGQPYDLSEQLCLLAALGSDPDLETYLARTHGFDRKDWLAADLFAVDAAEPVALGPQGLFMAPRIDNLTGCHAIVEALIASGPQPEPQTRLALCFDHEEIGSSTWTGADSVFLGDVLDRVHHQTGGTSEDWFRTKAASFITSVDAAHGVHPNWPAQHDEAYAPALGKGPVLKSSARFSYATTGASEALFRMLSAKTNVPLQTYIMKSTLTPGSTVGPIATSWTGIPGVDLGIPIWAMHSSRETADRRDQDAMVRLLTTFFNSGTVL